MTATPASSAQKQRDHAKAQRQGKAKGTAKGITERENVDVEELSSPRTPVIYEVVRRIGVGGYRSSYAGVSAAPLAVDVDGTMQRDGWWSGARRLADLESPEAIGKEAARRTIRRLGARRVPTQRVPIVFAREVAGSLVGHVFEGASGDAIWRGASFLAGKLGEQIAVANLTIVDDNTMLLPTGMGSFGTSPFDGEGLPSLRTVVVEKGVLRNYLLNTYTARKLGMKSTHNASRGLAGTPGIGCGNLYLEPGTQT